MRRAQVGATFLDTALVRRCWQSASPRTRLSSTRSLRQVTRQWSQRARSNRRDMLLRLLIPGHRRETNASF